MIYLPCTEKTLSAFNRQNTVARIWRRDHTVWKPDPTEISNRLGWLSVIDQMKSQLSSLMSFADSVRKQGIRHVVLLGMGGASLGAEVLTRVFGKKSGYPELVMLDSTVPGWIGAVTDSIDPAKTLFIVASKSGGTIETAMLYRYFRKLVEQKVGKKDAGRHFIAITDPVTQLAAQAEKEGFLHAFLNPADIGGRYSALSYFGMVPAALTGIDISKLLESAGKMQSLCQKPATENHGAQLGAAIGCSALEGKDKLTLLTSPSLGSFGLWLEQLIAESTGKESKGIIPIVGESLVAPEKYGNDRLFIYMRLEQDNNKTTDEAIECLATAGQPVIKLNLSDSYDLGAEFFRWEFAAACAGAVLGINPFDQPNVQATKKATGELLDEFKKSGRLPALQTEGSLQGLLKSAKPGNYFAVMAYIPQTKDTDRALARLRERVACSYKIATTTGYGPRFLHSTGQLHKGGPNTGLFLQITADPDRDIPVPGESYTFGTLAKAQALGDFTTLKSLGRKVVRVHIKGNAAEAIRKLAQEV